ncbi:MAG: hypothetical protein EOP79_13135 [Variovorax sp.]|nr:MAG: hypothetical protein EOP79_13135 [Variovorax sp.]
MFGFIRLDCRAACRMLRRRLPDIEPPQGAVVVNGNAQSAEAASAGIDSVNTAAAASEATMVAKKWVMARSIQVASRSACHPEAMQLERRRRLRVHRAVVAIR